MNHRIIFSNQDNRAKVSVSSFFRIFLKTGFVCKTQYNVNQFLKNDMHTVSKNLLRAFY